MHVVERVVRIDAQVRGSEVQKGFIFSVFVHFNDLFKFQFPKFGKVEKDAKNRGRDHVPRAPFGGGTLC